MQVYANIGTPLTQRTAGNGTVYYTFRASEHQGGKDGAARHTTWYDVVAFLDEVQADLLSNGQFVVIGGRLEIEAFMKKDGTPGAAAKIITSSIKPVEKGKRPTAPSEA